MAGKEKEEVKVEAKVDEVKPVIPEEEEKPTIPEGFTADEWADLSDAEKEGVLDKGEEEEEEEPDLEMLESIAGEEEPKPPEKKPEAKPPEEKKVEGEAKPPEEKVEKKPGEEKPPEKPEVPKEEAKPPEEKPPEPPPTILSDEELLKFRPVVLESELPMTDVIPPEVQAKLDELDTKYDAGEIDLKAYNKERDTINRTVVQQNISQRNELRNQKAWEKEQGHFLRNRPEYIEKSIKGNAMFGALGEAVKTLEKDPKYAGASGIELLIAADQAVKESFGLNPKPIKEPTKPKEKEVVKPAAPIPDVKTLADVPNAAPNPTESWATALDKLHGEAYEAALEKLTPEQRERYLNAR